MPKYGIKTRLLLVDMLKYGRLLLGVDFPFHTCKAEYEA